MSHTGTPWDAPALRIKPARPRSVALPSALEAHDLLRRARDGLAVVSPEELTIALAATGDIPVAMLETELLLLRVTARFTAEKKGSTK